MHSQIATKISLQNEYVKELEDLRLELSQEQQQQKERLRELNEEEKRRKMCQDLRDAMKNYELDKELKLQYEKSREELCLQEV